MADTSETFAQPTERCLICNETGTIVLTADQARRYDLWKQKKGHIQVLLNDLSNAEREQLMTGTHGDCWASQFAATKCDIDCDGTSHPGLWCN